MEKPENKFSFYTSFMNEGLFKAFLESNQHKYLITMRHTRYCTFLRFFNGFSYYLVFFSFISCDKYKTQKKLCVESYNNL